MLDIRSCSTSWGLRQGRARRAAASDGEHHLVPGRLGCASLAQELRRGYRTRRRGAKSPPGRCPNRRRTRTPRKMSVVVRGQLVQGGVGPLVRPVGGRGPGVALPTRLLCRGHGGGRDGGNGEWILLQSSDGRTVLCSFLMTPTLRVRVPVLSVGGARLRQVLVARSLGPPATSRHPRPSRAISPSRPTGAVVRRDELSGLGG